MKKMILAICIASTMIGASSCSKLENQQVSTSASTPSVAMTIAALTVGQMHNEVLEDYIALNEMLPPATTVITETQATSILTGIIEVGMDKGFINQNLSASQMAAQEILYMKAEGYFDASNNLKPATDRISTVVSLLDNTSLKAAITDINNYSGDMLNFLTFSHAKIAAVTGLSSDEQIAVDGFVSVLDESYNFWEPVFPEDGARLQRYVVADAIGLIGGYMQALRNHLPPTLAEAYALSRSLFWSYAQL